MESQNLLQIPIFANESLYNNKRSLLAAVAILFSFSIIFGGVFLYFSTLPLPLQKVIQPPASVFNMSESCNSPSTVAPSKQFHHQMLRILFLGDSLTEQGANPGGYISLLRTKYRRQIETIIRGFSGYTTANIIEYMPAILKNVVADVAFILLGTNDAKFDNAIPYCMSEYENNMNLIIDQVWSINTTSVYLITPPPCKTINFDNKTGFVLEHTERYRQVVKKIARTRNLKVIDTFEFIDPTTDLYDGIHFNDNGAAKVALQMSLIMDTHNLTTFLPMI